MLQLSSLQVSEWRQHRRGEKVKGRGAAGEGVALGFVLCCVVLRWSLRCESVRKLKRGFFILVKSEKRVVKVKNVGECLVGRVMWGE